MCAEWGGGGVLVLKQCSFQGKNFHTTPGARRGPVHGVSETKEGRKRERESRVSHVCRRG
jgi:hypothetical protein